MSRFITVPFARAGHAAGRSLHHAAVAAGAAAMLVLVPLLFVGSLVSLPVRAADPPPPADEPKPAEKPLKFTDEDLEKYRKHPPAEPAAPDAEGATSGTPQAPKPASAPKPAPAPVPAAGKGAPGAKTAPPTTLEPVPKPVPGATPATLQPPAAPVRPPTAAHPVPAAASPSMAKPPSEDPLKRWRDRDELEAGREKQLQDLRTQISGLESRLEFLNLKRLSVLDPTRIMPTPQNDEDRAADQAKGPRDLLAIVDKQIEDAEAELKQAKEALINIETRFAQESAQP
jgi:hypothetical protein